MGELIRARPGRHLALHRGMVTHMKTTIEIPDALLEQARAVAGRDGATLRELVEAGLRRELKERRSRTRFRLRDATVDGNGLQGGLQDADWDRIRDLAYQGRGA